VNCEGRAGRPEMLVGKKNSIIFTNNKGELTFFADMVDFASRSEPLLMF
jgi:hypothetical protein